MHKAQRASAGRAERTAEPRAHSRLAPHSDDLFATMYEQTRSVLKHVCGFYVVTYDDELEVARLAYYVDDDVVQRPDATFGVKLCDVLRERRTLINDSFTQRITEGVANSISVPMIRDGAILGAFGAFSREARTYDTRDAVALAAIAELGALALQNARFVAEIEKARHEAERLEEIGRAISASLELPKVLERVVDAALDLIDADSATVWLLKDNARTVQAAMTVGEIAPAIGVEVPVPPMLREHFIENNEPYFVVEDLKDGDHALPLDMRNITQARSLLAIVLKAENEVIGALSVGSREMTRYRRSDVRLLERLSHQAAMAVSNARLHEQLKALSLTDPLTNMPNRRHLYMFLDREFAAARRGRKLSVLLFDLDHFKRYNDRAGHQAGDEVLRAFARVLVSHTRAMNLAARYGGDEFITILADTDRHGAAAHAERILREIEKDPILSAAGVHASVGLGVYEPEMTSFEDVIRAADRDLYGQKDSRATGTR